MIFSLWFVVAKLLKFFINSNILIFLMNYKVKELQTIDNYPELSRN